MGTRPRPRWTDRTMDSWFCCQVRSRQLNVGMLLIRSHQESTMGRCLSCSRTSLGVHQEVTEECGVHRWSVTHGLMGLLFFYLWVSVKQLSWVSVKQLSQLLVFFLSLSVRQLSYLVNFHLKYCFKQYRSIYACLPSSRERSKWLWDMLKLCTRRSK
jgi:hypothetical protein